MYGFGFVLVKYRIALPAVVLYEKHPQYKPGFVAVMALAVINFIEFMWRAIRWRSRQAASARSGTQQH